MDDDVLVVSILFAFMFVGVVASWEICTFKGPSINISFCNNWICTNTPCCI